MRFRIRGLVPATGLDVGESVLQDAETPAPDLHFETLKLNVHITLANHAVDLTLRPTDKPIGAARGLSSREAWEGKEAEYCTTVSR